MRSALLALVALACVSCVSTEYRNVPAYNRYTVEDVLGMAKHGDPPDVIVRRLEQAHGFYPLTASQIVALHDEGMPLPVLDYMQQTYVHQIRREERFQLPQRFGAPY
ncbi:MAG TPA: hypothetical protein VFC24_06850 [Casimicrobiaceae bacterium]|nr:hypothetical protein [Casimicrobiaceae bacterium]